MVATAVALGTQDTQVVHGMFSTLRPRLDMVQLESFGRLTPPTLPTISAEHCCLNGLRNWLTTPHVLTPWTEEVIPELSAPVARQGCIAGVVQVLRLLLEAHPPRRAVPLAHPKGIGLTPCHSAARPRRQGREGGAGVLTMIILMGSCNLFPWARVVKTRIIDADTLPVQRPRHRLHGRVGGGGR